MFVKYDATAVSSAMGDRGAPAFKEGWYPACIQSFGMGHSQSGGPKIELAARVYDGDPNDPSQGATPERIVKDHLCYAHPTPGGRAATHRRLQTLGASTNSWVRQADGSEGVDFARLPGQWCVVRLSQAAGTNREGKDITFNRIEEYAHLGRLQELAGYELQAARQQPSPQHPAPAPQGGGFDPRYQMHVQGQGQQPPPPAAQGGTNPAGYQPQGSFHQPGGYQEVHVPAEEVPY